MPSLNDKIIETVRQHKEKATPAQLLLAHKLRFNNIVFQMEYAILTEHSFFTADFFIPRYGLLIEVDGSWHYNDEQKRKDFVKDLVYKSMGYNVIRIKNEDVDTFDTNSIKKFRKRKIKIQQQEETPNYKKIRGQKITKIKRKKLK